MKASTLLAGCTVALALFAPQLSSSQDLDQAEQLFVEGREALEAGDHATACNKFEGSLALATRASTLMNLGMCNEGLGKLGTAYRYWNDGISKLEDGDERKPAALERLAELEAEAPAVSLEVQGSPPAGAFVRVGDQRIGSANWDKLVYLDAGEHTFELMRDADVIDTASVSLVDGQRADVVLVGPAPETTTQVITTGTDLTIPAFVSLGVGAVGFIGFAVTGVLYLDEASFVEETCPGEGGSACPPEADFQAVQDAESNAETLLIINAVALGVGVVGTALGVTFLVISDDGGDELATVQPLMGPTPDGGGLFGFEGRF